jgi:hypothetical protein
MDKSKKSDFKIIDLKFITMEAEANEMLESAKEYADSEIGLFSLEARARKLSDGEMVQYKVDVQYAMVELSVVVWEGYAEDDLTDIKGWIEDQDESSAITLVELKAREMLNDEFEAFQACAPEYFEEA